LVTGQTAFENTIYFSAGSDIIDISIKFEISKKEKGAFL